MCLCAVSAASNDRFDTLEYHVTVRTGNSTLKTVAAWASAGAAGNKTAVIFMTQPPSQAGWHVKPASYTFDKRFLGSNSEIRLELG